MSNVTAETVETTLPEFIAVPLLSSLHIVRNGKETVEDQKVVLDWAENVQNYLPGMVEPGGEPVPAGKTEEALSIVGVVVGDAFVDVTEGKVELISPEMAALRFIQNDGGLGEGEDCEGCEHTECPAHPSHKQVSLN
jgi:hypothetical protein